MIKSFLKRYQKKLRPRSKAGGFTLLELLVALLIGSLISAGLLFMVVQIIETNLREAARSDTQRDLQAAIDYIARDVREAVFVYDADCLLDRPASPNNTRCPGLRSYLPEEIVGTTGFGATNNIPVLAFWRVDPLPKNLEELCSDNSAAYSRSAALPTAIANVPCLSNRMYSLVVYSLSREGGAVSRGRARIIRYRLPQFTGSIGTNGSPELVRGWVAPRGRTDGKETSFLAWPVVPSSLTGSTLDSLQGTNNRPISNNTNTLPLTDFVDWIGLYNPSDASGRGRALDRSSEGLILTPRNDTGTSASADPPRGFYVYVRGGNREGDLNQEVIIRIQGDAEGRPGIPPIAGGNDRPRIPISLETRVLTRGVTNKQL